MSKLTDRVDGFIKSAELPLETIIGLMLLSGVGGAGVGSLLHGGAGAISGLAKPEEDEERMRSALSRGAKGLRTGALHGAVMGPALMAARLAQEKWWGK
jgi:hypothetical protein